MLTQMLKTALRSLLRNKAYSLLVIFGLLLALVGSLLVTVYVTDELSYDNMHPHASNTYRVGTSFTYSGTTRTSITAPGDWATKLNDNVPEVMHTLRVAQASYPTSLHAVDGNKRILTDEVRWVESSFQNVLSLKILQGSQQKPFETANSMLISESAAAVLFADKSPIGKIVIVNDNEITRGKDVETIISGVYEDFPQNSTFRSNYLFNVESLRRFVASGYDLFDNRYYNLYVVLTPGGNAAALESHLSEYCRQMMEKERSDPGVQASMSPIIRSLRDLHFDAYLDWDPTGGHGQMNYLLLFSSIAFLIMLVACINYTNLTTAMAARRSKEISLKRTFGCSRLGLMTQFMMESSLLTIIAFAIAIAVSIAVLPNFNLFTGKHFSIDSFLDPKVILIFIGTGALVAILAGSYPAIFLSSFKSVELLKGVLSSGRRSDTLRKSLIGIQFLASVILCISTIVVVRQMNLMYYSKLNSNGDQVMALRWHEGTSFEKFELLRNELIGHGGITGVTIGNHLPRLDHFGDMTQTFVFPWRKENEDVRMGQLTVDFAFPSVFELEIVAGRDFDPRNSSDSNNVIINEAAARMLNLDVSAVPGREIRSNSDSRPGTIIGIVKDFPYKSMHHSIEPLVIRPIPKQAGSVVYVKMTEGDLSQSIEIVEQAWRKVIGDTGIESWFVDDIFNRMYKNERNVTMLIQVFAALVIAINLFGLVGLASYLTERRRKEIGLRKVLGAARSQVYWMFVMDFVRVYAVACVVAIPVAYFLLRGWLTGFAYQVDLGFEVFATSIVSLLAVIILTITFEIAKAVGQSPVDAIKSE